MKRLAGITGNSAVVPNPDGAYQAQRLIVGLVANIVPIRNSALRHLFRHRIHGGARMIQSYDDGDNTLETRIAVHEAACADRYGKLLDRVTRVEMVLYAIVALLLVGEVSVIDVLRRLLGWSDSSPAGLAGIPLISDKWQTPNPRCSTRTFCFLVEHVNRHIHELTHSQSSDLSSMIDADKDRIASYIKALRTARGWIMAQPILDVPETHPRMFALEAFPLMPEMEK